MRNNSIADKILALFWIIILLVSTFQANAQETGENKLGSWSMYIGNFKVAKNWSIYSEAHLRLYEPAKHTQQLLFSGGVIYDLNKKSRIGGGYAFLPSETYDKQVKHTFIQENRVWENFFLKNEIGRLKFRHRYQLEQRWLSFSDRPDSYYNRIRYQLFLTLPLNHKDMVGNTMYVAASDEIFMQTVASPFNQNRLYFGLGYKLDANLNFQAGYMRWDFASVSYDRLMVAIVLNLDFQKKE